LFVRRYDLSAARLKEVLSTPATHGILEEALR
jgi:hypothetical protein